MLKLAKQSLLNGWLAFRKRALLLVSLNHGKLLKRIKEISETGSGKLYSKIEDDLVMISSFRAANETRQKILQTAVPLTLKNLSGSDLDIRVIDSSPGDFVEKNKSLFEFFNLKKLRYEIKPASLPQAYEEFLRMTGKKFFCSFFDDQPIIGMNMEFLKASVQLLEDFAGLVDVVVFNYANDLHIENTKKVLYYNLESLDFKKRGIKPLGVVKYGNYSFAIVPNYLYGFFFNNIIGRTKTYLEKLSWYRKRISENGTHKIELFGMWKLGPSFEYIAVPLEVFMLDAGYEQAAGGPPRDPLAVNKKIFEALKNGYKLIPV